MASLCRDCLKHVTSVEAADRCPRCGSPRLASHPELFDLTIAHVDCDAFFTAVEKRDNPQLVNKPVVVGGGRRGVVAAACYIARTYGVHSAMPMFKALKACPRAVVVAPDHRKYSAVSKQIRTLMRATTPLVEPLSVDEAFLDLSGTKRLHKRPPAETLAVLAKRIEDEIGVTASIGLSYNKFLAKTASDLEKPRGFSVIGRADARSFLALLPVTAIYGVGRAFARRLHGDGIATLAQVQALPPEVMSKRYGAIGARLAGLARGEDPRAVVARRPAKSISAETTFERDIAELARLESILWGLCEKVAGRLKHAEMSTGGITLKLKTDRFRQLTRSKSLDDPTQLAETLFRAARPLLRAEATGARYRLIGISAGNLAPGGAPDAPPDLLDQGTAARARAERAIDKVRAKYGEGAIGKGRALRGRRGD